MEPERTATELGAAVRQRRTALGLTLDALAVRSGVSRAMLSEVERAIKSPTIKVACQIAEGLACSVSDLLGEGVTSRARSIEIVREKDRRVLVEQHAGVERHLLSPGFVRRGIEVIWYVVPPGEETGVFPPHQPGVAEHITVVVGRLDCELGDAVVVLEQGDSATFPANIPHGFRNSGPERCEYLLIIDASQPGN